MFLWDPINWSPPGSSVHGISEARILEWLPLPTPAAAAAKSLQSCPTPCNPIDISLPGSSIPGILQARTLEWVAISFSNAGKWKVKVKTLSRVRLLATPWTAAYQFLPPTPEDLPEPGVEPVSLVSPALTGIFFTTSATWEVPNSCRCYHKHVYICLQIFKKIFKHINSYERQ